MFSIEHTLHAGLNATLASNIRSYISCELLKKVFWWIFIIVIRLVVVESQEGAAHVSHMNLPQNPQNVMKEICVKFSKSLLCVFVVSASVMHSVRAWNVIKSLFSLSINRLWRLRVVSIAFIAPLKWLWNLNNVVKLSNSLELDMAIQYTQQISNLNFLSDKVFNALVRR